MKASRPRACERCEAGHAQSERYYLCGSPADRITPAAANEEQREALRDEPLPVTEAARVCRVGGGDEGGVVKELGREGQQ